MRHIRQTWPSLRCRVVCISQHMAGLSPQPRCGATWLDVVVAVVAIGLLAAVLLPAVNSPRRPAYRAECQNQTKQIVTAAMNYAERYGGRLPPLIDGTITGPGSNWAISLMMDLDLGAVRRDWDACPIEQRPQFSPPHLKVFYCPLDERLLNVDGGLSYVANAGIGSFFVDLPRHSVIEGTVHSSEIDWNLDGAITADDVQASLASGVFWRSTEHGNSATFDEIATGDGTSYTLLFTENTFAGSWTSMETMDVAFVVGMDRLDFADRKNLNRGLELKPRELGPYGIQGGRIPRHAPSPNSKHLGIIICGFADGGSRAISEKIDPGVFLRLMTSNGVRYGEVKLKDGEIQ